MNVRSDPDRVSTSRLATHYACPLLFHDRVLLRLHSRKPPFADRTCADSRLQLCEAISCIPGNERFEQRIEFTTAVKYFYGPRWHTVFQVFLNVTVQAYNIASIIICASSLVSELASEIELNSAVLGCVLQDQALIYFCGKTYALEFYPSFGVHAFDDADLLYSSSVIDIPLGYILIMLLCIPMWVLPVLLVPC